MIKIDRTRIAPPPELLEAAQHEAVKAQEFYTDPDNIRYGKPFNFRAYRVSGVRERLLELFHDKCAFCESKLGVSTQLDIDQFRPKAMAVNHDGSIDKPGYWWLAWEWSNLYPACPLCNRTKANRFPIVGQRAEFIEPGSRRNTINPANIPLRAVSVHSDGKSAITISENGDLYYCDLETANINFATLIEYFDPFFCDVTPNGKTAVLASEDGRWAIWDLSGKRANIRGDILTADERIRDLVISPDGRLAVLAVGTNLQVWDLIERRIIHRLEGHPDFVNALAISPDGRVVISAAEDMTLCVWDLESEGELRYRLNHNYPVYGVGITADGNRIVSLSAYGTLQSLGSGERRSAL